MTKKEKIIKVIFNKTPDVRLRVIKKSDKNKTEIDKEGILVFSADDKTKYPFKLYNDLIVTIVTDVRKFSFKIPSGYVWNGADIPKILWCLIGSKSDPGFLIPSMVHDFLLEKRKFMLEDVLKNEISMVEYRRLTSLIFRELLKYNGTKTIKSNIMSFAVQLWQCTGASEQWK